MRRRAWVGVSTSNPSRPTRGADHARRTHQLVSLQGSPGRRWRPSSRGTCLSSAQLDAPLAGTRWTARVILLDLRAGDDLVLSRSGTISRDPCQLEAVLVPVARLPPAITVSSATSSSSRCPPQVQGRAPTFAAEAGALVADISAELSSRTRASAPGDVIIQMNRARIRSADDAAAFFDALTGQEGRIVLYLERDNNYYTTSLYWRG